MFSLREWFRGGLRSLLVDRLSPPVPKGPRTRRWRPGLEELESRLTPTVNIYQLGSVLRADGDNLVVNTITVTRIPGMTEISATGAFADVPDGAGITSIEIHGGNIGTVTNIQANVLPVTVFGKAADQVNVGDPLVGLQHIQANLWIENPPSYNTIHIDDSADTIYRTVTHDTFTPGFGLGLWGRITGLTPDPTVLIAYKYVDTSAITVETGVSGATVNVLATGTNGLGTGLPLHLVGHSVDLVNVGNPADGVQDIKGPLRIENPPSYNAIHIDDSADTIYRTVTHDTFTPAFGSGLWGEITGLTPGSTVLIAYKYVDTSVVTVDLGVSGATVNVLATGTNGLGTGLFLTLVDHGVDTINVGDGSGVQDILGTLTIQDATPFPLATLNISNSGDSANRAVTESLSGGFGTITGLAQHGSISFQTSDLLALNVMTGSGVTTLFGGPPVTYFFGLGFPVNYAASGEGSIFFF
jgi:hypothetical protein